MATSSLRLASRQAALASQSRTSLSRFQSPMLALVQSRSASDISHPKAVSTDQSDAMQILKNQRLHRPVSPHLQIYKPQITWIGSGLNRITGVALSGGIYLFAASYLAASTFGLGLTSATMAASFAKWPVILKFLTKFTISMPFTYHSFNGIRHLVWDTGNAMTNQAVIKTGWTVVGLSAVTAIALSLM